MKDGERYIILGQSGMGKTLYITDFILRNFEDYDNIIIIDSVGEYSKLIPLSDRISHIDTDYIDIEKYLKSYYKMKKESYKAGHNSNYDLIVFDEMDLYTIDKSIFKGVNDIIYKLNHYGRKYGISVIGAVRSPFNLEKSIIRLSNYQIIFKMVYERDIKELGIRDKEIIQKIKDLNTFEYLKINL